jgi:tetratricopeptide (TPR) repeat protein
LHEAEALYRQVLAAAPNHFDALHLSGVLMHQRGRSDEALELISAALATNTNVAMAHHNHGLVLAALARFEEALAAYDRALALKPDYADALYSRGNALAALSRSDEAVASFDRAIALRPDYPNALLNRAQVLKYLGRAPEALADFDRAFALMRPDADMFVARGNTHYAMKSFNAALADYDGAAALRPDAAPLHNNRGNALRELGRAEEAFAAFGQAIAHKPDYAEAYNNRGNLAFGLNRMDEALADYEHALALKPDNADTLTNRGNVLHHLGRIGDAIDSFDRAIALKPDLAEAHWNKALTCLESGDFLRGWQGYEWRWRRGGEMQPRNFARPQWRGEDLRGKTVLLHAEQGFGDTLQFIRYLPMVVAKGAGVVLEIPDDLRPLIGDAAGVAAILRYGEAWPPFDLHCPLMSLPLAFGTTLETIPARVPYLGAPPDRLARWRARLDPARRPRVGLVWSGKPSHRNDHNRSIPLALLAPVLARSGLQFVSLQKEYRASDHGELDRHPALLRLDEELADFADTAAVIGALDLVIAVDTAVAHLAGAMGKPLWLLLPAIGDWRWLKERTDSPWYPTARLFRQPRIGDWASVITRIAQELAVFAGDSAGAA